MGNSLSAEAVAREVLETVRQGKIPNKQEIQIKHGYSPTSARAMKATRTQSYKRIVAPVAEELVKARQRAIERLAKVEKKASYSDLVNGIDKMTKNIQLLTGGMTEHVAIGIRQLTDEELQQLADGE